MAEQSGGLYSLSLMLGCLVSGIVVVLHDKLEASSRMFGATVGSLGGLASLGAALVTRSCSMRSLVGLARNKMLCGRRGCLGPSLLA